MMMVQVSSLISIPSSGICIDHRACRVRTSQIRRVITSLVSVRLFPIYLHRAGGRLLAVAG